MRGAVTAGAIDEQIAVIGKTSRTFSKKMIQRQGYAAGDVLLLALARGAHIHGDGTAAGEARQLGGKGPSAEPLGSDGEIGARGQTCEAALEIAGDVVEADAPEARGGFGLPAGIGDDDDGMLALEDGAGPGGVLPAQADVDAAGEMGGGEM